MKRAAVIVAACMLAAAGAAWWRLHWMAPPPGAPRAGEPWTNDLGMRFLPVAMHAPLFAENETRVRDFKAFVTATKRDWPQPGFTLEDEFPAVNVTWDDAAAFCAWLTERDRAARRIGRRQRYRLPAIAEWSLAAGTPEGQPFIWGSAWPPPAGAGNFAGEEAPVDPADPGTHIAGYRDSFPRLAPVGKFAPNRYGLHDIAGNALEWCEDWATPKKQGRAMRGGSWLNGDPDSLRAGHVAEIPARAGFEVTGFRCVLDADP